MIVSALGQATTRTVFNMLPNARSLLSVLGTNGPIIYSFYWGGGGDKW